ncbi:uncharacterized protein F54H12.2-like [Tetranychus urticae]|uniref:Uncharacterized protein n=1 Tax=Tetranychus urticae TaxID=32264 RepID=A0A158P4E5_TETUR|nr:uncharacterized protein F54H12.2-like [Tetranychus urticae]
MEYLHSSSLPVSKSEIQIFAIPPTQTAIESTYEVEYRPGASLEQATSYEIDIPASEDFTDLASTYVHLLVNTTNGDGTALAADKKVSTIENFGNALFNQIDMILGSINTIKANNTYPYLSYIEDRLFKHRNNSDIGSEGYTDQDPRPCDMYFRLHLPMCTQDKLLINGVPLRFKFSKSLEDFVLMKRTDDGPFKVKFDKFSIFIKRVKLFPEAQKSIIMGLEKGPAKYFITRNEVKTYSISADQTSVAIENVYSGSLPKRVLVGLVDDKAFTGSLASNPYEFKNFGVNYIALSMDGIMIPSIPYQPNFSQGQCMREFMCLYRYFNQDEGLPQIDISYADFKKDKTFFAFDLTPDGTIGAETGTLSLVKRGHIRLDLKFAQKLSSSIKVIVFAQFDNLITIDSDRKVFIDY